MEFKDELNPDPAAFSLNISDMIFDFFGHTDKMMDLEARAFNAAEAYQPPPPPQILRVNVQTDDGLLSTEGHDKIVVIGRHLMPADPPDLSSVGITYGKKYTNE